MRNRFSILASLALCAFAVAAHADTFNFSFSGVGLNASGTFTTTDPPVGGIYTVTGIAGEANGQAITSLDAVGSYESNDNQISLTSPYFDFSGLAFNVSGTDYTIGFAPDGFFGPAGLYECSGDCSDVEPVAASVTTTATPEPSSIALLGTGILTLAGAARRRLTKA